jgi:PAS domain S-box-containing protein
MKQLTLSLKTKITFGVRLGAAVLTALRGAPLRRFACRLFGSTGGSREDRQQMRQMQLAVQQSPVSIVITDCAGCIEYVNPKFTQLTGYSSAEVLGQNSRILKTGETPAELYRQLWGRISTGSEWHGEILNKKKSGEHFWESVCISAITNSDGAITHYLAVKEDITARKALEQELRSARDAAEAGNRLKSEFLTIMSHEIRTPMNGIIGMAELLKDTELTGEQTEYAGALLDSAGSLMGIINDVLDFSRLEERKLQLESVPFRLRASLGNILRTLAGRASEKGLALDFRIPPEVPDALVGDPGRLIQIVVNLVSNAIKFTEDGEVVLCVTLERQAEGEVCLHFAVSDTGIGISVEKQRRVFDPFSQADASSTRRHGGAGLGLTISARLVEMMGGALRVESAPDQGSSFHFSLCLGLQQGTPMRRSAGAPELLPPPETLARPGDAGAELFDLQDTLARMDGDWELFREVIEIFAVDSRKMLAVLHDAIAAGDGRRVNRAAHTIKGALGNFSARGAMELTLKLEGLGKSGDLTGAWEEYAALESELECLREALESCTGGMGT